MTDDNLGNARQPEQPAGITKSTTWAHLVSRIGEPPMDPLGNAEWANNASALLAYVALTSNFSDTVEKQVKLCMRLIDRVISGQSKAIITREIRQLQEKAGIKQAATPDADRLIPVHGGSTLRAAGRAVRRGDPARPVLVVPPQNDRGGTF